MRAPRGAAPQLVLTEENGERVTESGRSPSRSCPENRAVSPGGTRRGGEGPQILPLRVPGPSPQVGRRRTRGGSPRSRRASRVRARGRGEDAPSTDTGDWRRRRSGAASWCRARGGGAPGARFLPSLRATRGAPRALGASDGRRVGPTVVRRARDAGGRVRGERRPQPRRQGTSAGGVVSGVPFTRGSKRGWTPPSPPTKGGVGTPFLLPLLSTVSGQQETDDGPGDARTTSTTL